MRPFLLKVVGKPSFLIHQWSTDLNLTEAIDGKILLVKYYLAPRADLYASTSN